MRRLSVGVPQLIVSFVLLPPKFNLAWFVSSLWSRILQTIFHLSAGTPSLSIKKMLVIFFLPGMPCARCPTLFPNEYPCSSLYFGRFMRCWYSTSLPVSASSTDLAKSVRNPSLKLLLAACCGMGQLPDILVALSNCCCCRAERLAAGLIFFD